MQVHSIVQFDRAGLLLGIIEGIETDIWYGEERGSRKKLIVRFLPELYNGYRFLDNCLKHDKLWVVG